MPLINVKNRCRKDLRNFFSVTKTYWKDQLFPVTFVLRKFSYVKLLWKNTHYTVVVIMAITKLFNIVDEEIRLKMALI